MLTSKFFEHFITFGFAIGLAANALFFLPQAWKLYKTKNSVGVSSLTFLGFNIIQLFTAAHAFMVGDYILFVGSIIAFLTCGLVTILSFLY